MIEIISEKLDGFILIEEIRKKYKYFKSKYY